MKLYKLNVAICEACLRGEGSECHTPGCAFFIHSVPQGEPTLWQSWHDVPGALDLVGGDADKSSEAK